MPPAVQVDPTCVYAHTLCGHEYLAAEDLDSAAAAYKWVDMAAAHAERSVHWSTCVWTCVCTWLGVRACGLLEATARGGAGPLPGVLATAECSCILAPPAPCALGSTPTTWLQLRDTLARCDPHSIASQHPCHLTATSQQSRLRHWLPHRLTCTTPTRTRSAALAHDPRHYNALYGLGQILLRQERPEQAVHKFAEASKISPGSSVLQCYLGIALARLGRHEQAIRVLQQAVQRDPRNPLAR
jgi:tetratricopeptide (TPR) repeat protein